MVRHIVSRLCKLKLPTGSYPGDSLRDILNGIVTEGAEMSKCCARREETREEMEKFVNLRGTPVGRHREESEGQWEEAKWLKGIKQRWKEANVGSSQIGASGESPLWTSGQCLMCSAGVRQSLEAKEMHSLSCCETSHYL